MKSFYFLAVFLALGLANCILFLHLLGPLLAIFLPPSLLWVCSQHLLLLWLRILERVLVPSVFCPIRSQPAAPSTDSGKPSPPPGLCFLPPLSYALSFLPPGPLRWILCLEDSSFLRMD